MHTFLWQQFVEQREQKRTRRRVKLIEKFTGIENEKVIQEIFLLHFARRRI